jgi:sulfonate transport system ATP-binding protein
MLTSRLGPPLMNLVINDLDISRAGVDISIHSATKRYGSRIVLSGFNLNVGAGEFVAIVGRSGCGKSTLLRLLAGLEGLDSGEVLLDHQRISGIDPRVRMMFQEPRLLPWQSIENNLMLGLPLSFRTEIAGVLENVGLSGREKDWPRTLSGGQKQRAALARALIHRPACLLLDEPLGALDALTRIEMQRLIESIWLKRRFTAVLVTHDVSEAVLLADRIVLIDSGRIAMDRRVTIPRPRKRGDLLVGQLEEKVLQHILGVQ